MDDLLAQFNRAGIRYLLVGGQAMRLAGMPRYSMDWDFFIPPRDVENLARLNALPESELDEPLVPLGPRGENFIQTYQTRWGVLQFHLGLPGVPRFDEAEKRSVDRPTERGTPARCLGGPDLLAAKRASGRPQDQADCCLSCGGLAKTQSKSKAGGTGSLQPMNPIEPIAFPSSI